MITINVTPTTSRPKWTGGSVDTDEVLKHVDQKLETFKKTTFEAPLVENIVGTEVIPVKCPDNTLGTIEVNNFATESFVKSEIAKAEFGGDGNSEIPKDILDLINILYTSSFNESFNTDFAL